MQKQPPDVEMPRGFAVAPPQANATLPTEDLCIRLNIYDLYCLALPRLRVFPSLARGTQLLSDRRCHALQETGQTDRLHFRASAGAGLVFTTAAGLDAREVAATMAQWITGYGPGRI